MNQAVIGIGSNINPVENTAEAIKALAEVWPPARAKAACSSGSSE